MDTAGDGAGRGRHPWLLPVLLAPAFMVILDIFIINVAAPSLRADLGASESDIQLVVVAYILSFAISLVTGGRLGDLVGRRLMFRAGVAGFTIASVICALAPSPSILIAGRLLQGFAGAAMLPQMLSIIQVEYRGRERQQALSMQNVVQALASIVGQIVGGCLIAIDPGGLGWRTIFLINIPIGLATLAFSPVIPESRSPRVRQLDLRGVGLASLALALFLVPAIEGREWGWPPWVFVAIAASVPVGLLFVRAEKRLAAAGGAPLVEPRLFEQRGFRVGVASVVVLFAAYSLYLWFSIYLQDGLGLSALEAGLVYTPMACVSACVSLTVPRLAWRHADRYPEIGALCAGCALVAMAIVASQIDSFSVALILALMPLGAGLGLVMPTMMKMVLHMVPTAEAGSAAGTVTTAQQVGNAAGVAVVGTLFFSVLGSRTGADAYGTAFAISTGAQAVFTLAAAWMLSRARERTPPAALGERGDAVETVAVP